MDWTPTRDRAYPGPMTNPMDIANYISAHSESPAQREPESGFPCCGSHTFYNLYDLPSGRVIGRECEDCGMVCAHEDEEYTSHGIYCPTCEWVTATVEDLREDDALAWGEMMREDFGY